MNSGGSGRWANWQVVLAVGIGLLLYLRSPIDLLPDRMGPLGLLDDVIVLGGALYWLSRRLGEGSAASGGESAASAAIPSDPWEVLQVDRGASAEEITRAYREQMKRYHPDRVADLGADLQRVAHERTLAIQRAYDAIGRR
jgi:DnaJ like chaperone protein